MAIRILLAEDQKIIREGLISLLANQTDMKVVGEAGDGREAVRLACELKPDIVVMDVNMPEMDGIDATSQIVARVPHTRIVTLSMYPKRSFIEGMLKAGASAYVLKDRAFSELVKAINTVIDGEIYLCPKAAGIMVNSYIREKPEADDISGAALTARECEILSILAEGRNTKQIALKLGISTKTVDTHRRHIMHKLDMQSLPELTKYAIRKGLTSLE